MEEVTVEQKLPHHVAIVMDGNGRWAESRGLQRIEGHRVGLEVVKAITSHCVKRNIGVLSLFAFSSENWARPEFEVDFLMQLFIQALESEIQELHDNGVRLLFSGDRSRLSMALCQRMEAAEQMTGNNTQLRLNVAMNYGGKWDIVQAVQAIAKQVQANQLSLDSIDEMLFAKHLNTAGLPDPDLFIRTSGEQRISNFFLWQLAYTELYFTDTYWPDFTTEKFDEALVCYGKRKRRYGLISEQQNE